MDYSSSVALITSQKIAAYYEKYRSVDVTFTKEVIQVTGMLTQQIFLKCGGDFWPCVVYSTSMQSARIVVNVKSGIIEKLKGANNMASLRFSFRAADEDSPVTFFISVKITEYGPYGESKDMNMFSLQFTQRPPDDLIEVLGRLLDANYNSVKRRNARIGLSPEAVRRLKVLGSEAAVFIGGVPRRCILRELSFGGAKLVLVGVAKFLVQKESALKIEFDDPRENFNIKGKFVAADAVEGRQDLLAVDIEFTEALIPMGYKIRINNYLSQFAPQPEKAGIAPSPAEQEKRAAAVSPALQRTKPEKTPTQNAVDSLKAMKKAASEPPEDEGVTEKIAAPPDKDTP
ncbi:MAG: pilus assembly protein PilZ [Spirochaetaceae bacterium]|nr:pilus assembly protein PilZ [Spirochaetaceae bacterium]